MSFRKEITPVQQDFKDFEKRMLGKFKVTQSDVSKSLTTIIDTNEGAFQKFGIASPARCVEEFFGTEKKLAFVSFHTN